MEAADRDLILEFLKRDVKLQRLYKEHMKLEEQLSRYERRQFLTAPEEVEQKKLKQRKLKGVDRIMDILATHRRAA